MSVIGKRVCDRCGQTINDREITLFIGLVEALMRVCAWAVTHNRDSFERKDVKHLFRGESVSARFGDWVHFGDLVTKPAKKFYQLDLLKCFDFFEGKTRIPTRVYFNRMTGEIRYEDHRYIQEIASISDLLDKHGNYIALYEG